jgi:hypothetical protein
VQRLMDMIPNSADVNRLAPEELAVLVLQNLNHLAEHDAMHRRQNPAGHTPVPAFVRGLLSNGYPRPTAYLDIHCHSCVHCGAKLASSPGCYRNRCRTGANPVSHNHPDICLFRCRWSDLASTSKRATWPSAVSLTTVA